METTTINTPHNTVTMVTPEQVVTPVQKPSFDHHRLLSALYFMQDGFERAQMEFFLVKDTAKKAMTEYQLEGDHLDIGVRINEWNNGNDEILVPYLEAEGASIENVNSTTKKVIWKDIPIFIHLYEDNPCITALNSCVYEYESWNIPNQFPVFEKEFDK